VCDKLVSIFMSYNYKVMFFVLFFIYFIYVCKCYFIVHDEQLKLNIN